MKFETVTISDMDESSIALLWDMLEHTGEIEFCTNKVIAVNTLHANGKYTVKVLEENVVDPASYLCNQCYIRITGEGITIFDAVSKAHKKLKTSALVTVSTVYEYVKHSADTYECIIYVKPYKG